ncbi:hypothetical protein QCA50_007290 [Cerrena zonata]|uniref:Uncharacterized protein n=1 Tax=Cerrena zonata TaxID=2478898 RepID=A0AAW0G771_9APHY
MSAYGRTAELYDFTVIIPDCGQTDYTGEFNALQCVLDDCGPNLCSFDLFIDIDSKDFNPPPLYLRENSELEDITYKVVGVPMLQYVVEQLRTLDESTAVSQLAIDYCSNGKPSEPIWMLLDRITENKAMFPLNGRLAVAYHENDSKEEREHNVEKWCQETLPRCMPSLWQRDALIWEDWLWEDPTYSSFLNRD